MLREELPFGGDITLDVICKFKKKNGVYYADIQQAKSVVNDIYDFQIIDKGYIVCNPYCLKYYKSLTTRVKKKLMKFS